ncbi:hypothetical protein BDN72DRAFT_904609 [Pluteus cervinus]|uniref:Uncharacterized protein n=1 Tax=Pluteus cervinus TaxID=181527 RepID=A0ACD3A6E9_9AGAR|nr:hypothetical protein BDN72DRAFT_904609 [Pluteus cervinus]
MSNAIKAVIGHPFRDPNFEELETTIPLVALSATMIHAALLCWRTGHHRHIKFNADDHYNAYTRHVLVLNTTRERKPKSFHRLMAELLTDAVSRSKKDTTTTTDGDAIAAVDFDAMED